MITYGLAQSFLTSILRVGVCIIACSFSLVSQLMGFVERADRKRRHLGFDIERWVGPDGSSFPFLRLRADFNQES